MTRRIVFSIRHRRPGCALFQGLLGGTPGILAEFPDETWIVGPQSLIDSDFDPHRDLKCYRVKNDEELRKLIAMACKAVGVMIPQHQGEPTNSP